MRQRKTGRRVRKTPKRFTRRMRYKMAGVFLVFVLLLFALNGVLTYINYTKGDEYEIQVLSQQQYTSQIIPFKRGDILDRNNTVLATSEKVYNLILDPKIILSEKKYLEPTVGALTSCYEDLDAQDVTDKIQKNKDSSYLVLKKKLSYDDMKKLKDLMDDSTKNANVKGLWFEDEYRRSYPYSTLACGVLGSANANNTGNSGIEVTYSDQLNGVDGREYGYTNDDNNIERVKKSPKAGNNVISTLDLQIQTIVEEKIAQYQQAVGSQGISVLVGDPNSGEILAMASNTIYDLNNPRDLSKSNYELKDEEIMKIKDEEEKKKSIYSDMWKNKAVTDTFEPGSTAKPFTVGMALEENLVNADSVFYCDGGETFNNTRVNCNALSGHGSLTLQQTITYSCNDDLMQIGLLIGSKKFAAYQARYGFGSKTGIDLPGESAGVVYSANDMKEIDLACCAFGQSFTVNMVQMFAGYSSLVNGGDYYIPHVVRQVVNSNGGLISNVASNPVKQTVTQGTSDFLKDALRTVVLDGTGEKAAVPGYDVGGKTGTAEKLPRGNNEYVLSFIGSVPCDNPQVVCYVVIDTPRENPSDSSYAAELFGNIMTEVLPYMNIYQTQPVEEETQEQESNASDGVSEIYEDGIIDGNDTGVVDEQGGYGTGQ